MAYARDPVSEWFDEGARRLLDRAYARPGDWVTTRLANPGPQQLVRLAALGVNPFAPDRPSRAAGGGLDARNRWARAFVRAIYYQHRNYSGRPGGGWRTKPRTVPRTAGALEVKVGRMLPVRGVIPAGREVRVRRLASRRHPPTGQPPGGWWSDPARRDW